jgi:VCBS repeat-containing protein
MFFEALEGRQMMVADAINDAGVTNENTILTTVAPGSTTTLLANDTGNGLSVMAFSANSAQGATVNVNSNGTFSYNPTAAPLLQKLGNGESVVDTFTYTARENVFTVDGLFRVQLVNSTGTVPGNDTNNWQNIFNALDGGAGPTGTVAGFNIVNNQSDTETNFDYAGGGDFGVNRALNTINNNDGPGGGPGPFNGNDDYAVRARTFLRFPAAGTFTIALGSDDGRRIRLTPAFAGSAPGYTGFTAQGDQVNGAFTPGDTVIGFSGGTGHDQSVGTFDVAAGDVLALDAFYYQGAGGHSGEISLADGAFGSFTNTTDFSLLQNGLYGIDVSSVGFSSDTATVSITVNGVNAAPVAAANAYATGEDAAFSVTGYVEVPGVFLETYRAPSINDQMATADNARATLSPVATATELVTDMYDPEGHFPAGNFSNNIPFPGNTGGDDNNYAVFGTGFLRVLVAGTYTFGTSTDDNSRIRIDLDRDGVLEGNLTSLGGGESHPGGGTVAWQPTCCGNVFGTPVTLAAGDYRYEVVYTEGGGGSSGEFFYAPGSHGSFNAAFRLIGDSSQGIASFAVIANPGVLGNDTDEEATGGSVTQTLTVTQLNGGALTGTSALGATVTLSPNGGFTYNPNVPGSAVQALAAGQVAVDSFTYTVSDNAPGGALTATATVNITVTGANDLPTAVNNSYTTNENTNIVTTDVDVITPRNNQGDATPGVTTDDGVLVNDTDIDTTNVLEVYRVQSAVLSGTLGTLGNGSATATTNLGASVTMNDNGTFTYNPSGSSAIQALSNGQSLVDSFTYQATDGQFTFLPQMNVQVYNQQTGESIAGTFATADTVRGSRAPNFSGTITQADIVGQPGGHYSVNTTLPGTADNTENYAVYINGVLRVTVAGVYTFGTFSDDNSRIRIDLNQNGNVNDDGNVVTQGSCCGDSFGQATLAVGDYAFEAMYTEGGGGDYGEFFYAPGAQGGFNAAFRLLGDNTGPVLAGSLVLNTSTATVNITVNGINTAPVANANTYATNEDTAITVPATQPVPGMNVLVYDGTNAALPSADIARNSNTNGDPVNPPSATGTIALADLGTAGDGAFAGQGGVPAPGGGDSYAVFLTGILRVNNASNPGNMWTFGTFADDASRIRIDLDQDGILEGSLSALGGETVALMLGCCSAVLGGAVNIPNGDYAFELVFTEGGGGDYGEFFYAPGNPAFSNTNYALIGDASKGITAFSSIARPGLLGNDTDEEVNNGNPGQTLTVTQLNGGALTGTSAMGAQVTVNADGSFTYNPNVPGSAVQALAVGQVATDSFTYTVSDNAAGGALTAVGNVSIAVTGRNDLPIANNDNYTVNENTILNNSDTDAAPRNQIGDTTPGIANDDGVLVNDIEVDNLDIVEVISTRTILGPGMSVAVYNQQGAETGYGSIAGADAIRNTVGRLPNQTGTVQQADFIGNGGSPHFSVNNAFPGTGGDNYAVYLTGLLRVTVGGTYTFGVNTDDNSRIRIDLGAGLVPVAQHNGCCGDVFGAPVTLAAGDYPFEAMYTEGGGGDYGEFFYAPGSHSSFNASFRLLGDASAGISSLRYSDSTLSGTLGTLGNGSSTFTSALGATVVLDDDGTFTYNPTVSTTLQMLPVGQNAVDSFTYTATDNRFAPGMTIKVYQPTGAGDLAATDAFLAGSRPNERFNGVRPTVNFLGTGGAGQFNGAGTASPMDDEIPTPGLGGGDQNDFIVEATGKIVIPAAGDYTFSVNSDDGFGLVFSNGPGTVNLVSVSGDNDGTSTLGTVNPRLRRSTGRGSTDTFGVFNFSAPGEYDLRLVNWEGGGGANVEFFAAPGAFTTFGATNTWRLVGDTDNGGLQTFSLTRNVVTAMVNITVTGVNDNPVANDDGPFTTNENTSLIVTAGPVFGMNYAVYNRQGAEPTYGTFAAADAIRGSRAANATGTILQADVIGQAGGHFNVDATLPGTADNTEDYAVYLSGILRVTTPGLYTFGTLSDDNSRIRIDLNQDGNPNNDGNVVTQPGCCGDVFGQATLAVGDYAFEAMYTEGGGGDYGEFFYAPGAHGGFNGSFRLLGDASAGIASISSFNGLMANDSDIDTGDTIAVDTATIVSANGATITPLANGSFTYNPATSQAAQLLQDGQTLTDTFVYILRDSQGATDTGTVTVVVTGISDPVNDFYTVNEDNPGNGIDLTVPAGTGVLANDALPGNPPFEVVRAHNTNLSGTVGVSGDGSATVSTSAGGTVTINDNGSFTYDQLGVFNSLPQGQTATDTFTYVVGGAVGTPVVTTNSSAGTFPVSNTDLLQGLSPVVTGTALGGQEGTSSNPAILSNGTFGPAGLPDAAALAQTVSISNNTTLTYTLNTLANPLGYDISQIHTYSGWRDNGRDNQDYTVQYEQVGNPGVWVNFTGTVSFTPGTPPSGQVSITSPTGFIATGVSAVQFVFGNQENGYVGYRELDVIGTPRVTTTVTITVNGLNDPPIAEANGPYNINLGQDLALSAAGSADVDTGTVLTYGWDFNLDNVIDFTTSSQTPTVAWQTLQTLSPPLGAGSHTIRLTVSDGLAISTDTATLNISDNFVFTPVANGTPDGYLLILNPAQTIIEIRDTVTNALLRSVPRVGTNQVTFVGNGDNETLTVDYANTSPIPASLGVTFTAAGQTGIPGDTLALRNGTANTITHTYINANDGSVNIDGRIINYTGLEPIADNMDAANRVFTFTGGNETITLQNIVAGTSLQISSTLGEVTTFPKPTDSLTINMQTGSTDVLNITSATLMGNFTVNGSDGNDNVNVTGAVAVAVGASLPGLVSVTAGTINLSGGSITTVNNVNLTAAGQITTSSTAVDINAVNLVAAAGTGISLDTNVDSITGTVSGAGAITFDETNAVTLQNVTTANGAITFTTTAAGNVTVENVNSGGQNTTMTLFNGNLVSGGADPGVADIVANQLMLTLNTVAMAGHTIGTSAANRLEIDVNQLQATIATGTNNSAWIVNTAGNLTMNDSTLAANGTTVFDVLVLNGSLFSVVGGLGDARAVHVILAVTGAGSTIGASAAAPFEVNAATGSTVALVNATTAGGPNDHIFLRDVADNFPIGVINAGAADAFLTTTVGSIIDNANDAVLDITAGRLVMSSIASGGIGTGANGNLETQVGSLEATGGSTGVFLANTGNLTIGGISGAVGVSATGGDIVVSTAGSMTINENVTATGATTDVTLTATDAAAAGQDIIVGPGVTISSASATVTLNAGDNVSLTATSNISAPASTITINVDNGNLDAAGGTLTIASGSVLTATSATFNGANPGAAADADTFTFAPQVSTPIVVNGFNPTVAPGDVLNLSLAGTTGTTLFIDGVNDGTYTFTNRASVEYNSIEDVNAISGSYDLVLNMAGFGVPGNFTIRRSAPFVGTDLVIVNNTTATVVFTGDIALITSLRVLGTTGNDDLTVDDVNGMVSFDPLLTPTFVFPNNPIGPGTPRLLFDGAAGMDNLNFTLTEAGTSQIYAIGTGAGPGSGEGEIQTTNNAGRNLVTYFTNLGNDGSQVNRTGTAAGTLTIAGDAAANTINVQSNGTETRVDPLTYTPFDFSGNNYTALLVNSLGGDDLLDLISLGSAQNNNPTIVFDAGTQDDTLRVRSTSGNTSPVGLFGGTGNDTFQLYDTSPTVDGIAGQVIVNGTDGNVGGNTDTLIIDDRADGTADNVLIAAVNPGASQDYGIDGINGVAVTDVIVRNIDVLDYTATSASDTIDTQLVNTVPPHDLSTVSISGWLGADQFYLFTSDQLGGTSPTPTGVASGVATVSLYGDAPGNPNLTDGNDIFGATPTGLTGTGASNVGLVVPDSTRMIRPSASTAIAIDGGQPTGLVPPMGDVIGDTLNVDISALPNTSPVVVSTFSPGTIVSGGIQPLTWTQIEDINLVDQGRLTNVQMGDLFGRMTPAADLVQISRNPTLTNPNQVRLRITATIANYSVSNKTIIYGGGGNDTITQSNLTVPAEFYGEDGDDYLSGAMNNDWLVGGLGNDRINGSGGDNVIWGDNSPTIPSEPQPQDLAIGGNDTLSALGGNDVFYGGGGDDTVSAGGGNDYAYGGQGNDTLGGSDGDDRLYGGLGDDVLGGASGNDLLSGAAGNDHLQGDTGNDVLFGGTGADTIGGGDGSDLIVSGSVANESSSWTSVASTTTYNAATYTNPADNDAALLTLLTQWASTSSRAGIGGITHDGQDDDLFGGTGDDDFSWETIDVLDDFPAMAPADFNAFGMGTDERFGPV